MPRQQVPRRRELTEEERAKVVLWVLQNSVDGVPRLGTMKKRRCGIIVEDRLRTSLLSWRGCGGSVTLAAVRFAQLRVPVVFLVRRCIAVLKPEMYALS
ncbi:hypothetical protein PC110_g22815 [Phytophthora cactorum]|uniref:Uncharacterized protein n=1 Tax=Phytophthora cactorum TaxID=29920 RepID=A0A329RBB9_9STRA|nr:hypothetical protein PC110_g22815 [Phytophthora cactorum]